MELQNLHGLLAKTEKMMKDMLISLEALNESAKRLESKWSPYLATSPQPMVVNEDINTEHSAASQLITSYTNISPELKVEDEVPSLLVDDADPLIILEQPAVLKVEDVSAPIEEDKPLILCSDIEVTNATFHPPIISQGDKSHTEVLHSKSPIVPLQEVDDDYVFDEYVFDEVCVRFGFVTSSHDLGSVFGFCTLSVCQIACERFRYNFTSYMFLQPQTIFWGMNVASFLLDWLGKPFRPPDVTQDIVLSHGGLPSIKFKLFNFHCFDELDIIFTLLIHQRLQVCGTEDQVCMLLSLTKFPVIGWVEEITLWEVIKNTVTIFGIASDCLPMKFIFRVKIKWVKMSCEQCDKLVEVVQQLSLVRFFYCLKRISNSNAQNAVIKILQYYIGCEAGTTMRLLVLSSIQLIELLPNIISTGGTGNKGMFWYFKFQFAWELRVPLIEGECFFRGSDDMIMVLFLRVLLASLFSYPFCVGALQKVQSKFMITDDMLLIRCVIHLSSLIGRRIRHDFSETLNIQTHMVLKLLLNNLAYWTRNECRWLFGLVSFWFMIQVSGKWWAFGFLSFDIMNIIVTSVKTVVRIPCKRARLSTFLKAHGDDSPQLEDLFTMPFFKEILAQLVRVDCCVSSATMKMFKWLVYTDIVSKMLLKCHVYIPSEYKDPPKSKLMFINFRWVGVPTYMQKDEDFYVAQDKLLVQGQMNEQLLNLYGNVLLLSCNWQSWWSGKCLSDLASFISCGFSSAMFDWYLHCSDQHIILKIVQRVEIRKGVLGQLYHLYFLSLSNSVYQTDWDCHTTSNSNIRDLWLMSGWLNLSSIDLQIADNMKRVFPRITLYMSKEAEIRASLYDDLQRYLCESEIVHNATEFEVFKWLDDVFHCKLSYLRRIVSQRSECGDDLQLCYLVSGMHGAISQLLLRLVLLLGFSATSYADNELLVQTCNYYLEDKVILKSGVIDTCLKGDSGDAACSTRILLQ